MMAVVHGVGDEVVSEDVEAVVAEHLEVGLGVEVTPEHWGAELTLPVVVFGEIAGAEAK